MNEARASNLRSDLLNELVGIEAASPVGELRAQRAEIAGFIQASYDALLEPKDEAGVSREERGLIALRVAKLEDSAPLIEHYYNYLSQQQTSPSLIEATEQELLHAPLSPRMVAILEQVDRLTLEPRVATVGHLAGLKAHGLSDADLVTISQLISFLSFQVRAIVGLQLLSEGK